MVNWGYIVEKATGALIRSITASSKEVTKAKSDPSKVVFSSFSEVQKYRESKRKK